MGLIAPARLTVNPHYLEPELISTIAQPSGFAMGMGGGKLRVRLSDIDKVVYQNRVDIRTAVASSQATYNMLPSATISLEYAQTATYMAQTRQEYDDIDVAEAANWNVALPQAYRLGARQGLYQFTRDAFFYGVNAGNNEGILNTPGAVTTVLPPDMFGNTTLLTYDNGQMAQWLLSEVLALLTPMYQLGTPTRVVITGPQQDLGYMQIQGIVQVTSYQRPGAGTATIAQVLETICEGFDIEIEFAYDDTLIGQGSGSNDLILMQVPEAVVPVVPGVNTDEFATLQPQQRDMIIQYANMAAPVEITTPIPGGGVDVVSRYRISAGWVPRPQALRILSIPYN